MRMMMRLGSGAWSLRSERELGPVEVEVWLYGVEIDPRMADLDMALFEMEYDRPITLEVCDRRDTRSLASLSPEEARAIAMGLLEAATRAEEGP